SAVAPGVNAAQEVRPMNGGIAVPSTVTFTSFRGKLTFHTFSSLLNVDLAPVTCSIFAASIGAAALATERCAAQNEQIRNKMQVRFMTSPLRKHRAPSQGLNAPSGLPRRTISWQYA